MIFLKSPEQVKVMRKANLIVRDTLLMVGDRIKAGVTTAEVDRWVKEYIESRGAVPSCLGYEGYPASTCISIDDVVVHGYELGAVDLSSSKWYLRSSQSSNGKSSIWGTPKEFVLLE